MLFSPLEDPVLRILMPVQFKASVSGAKIIEAFERVVIPRRLIKNIDSEGVYRLGEFSAYDMVWDIRLLASNSKDLFNSTGLLFSHPMIIYPLRKYSYICLTNERFSGERSGTTPEDCGLLLWQRMNEIKFFLEQNLRF